LFKRGEIIQRKFKGIQKGEQPQGEFKQGEQSQDENGSFGIDVKGGELITLLLLMFIDGER
jgi:hypothetical protein